MRGLSFTSDTCLLVSHICFPISGLYLWNGMALFSTLSAIITWMVQFYLRLTHNVLIREYK